MRIFQSITGKIWLTITLFFILLLLGLGYMLGQYYEENYLRQQAEILIRRAEHIAAIITAEPDERIAVAKIEALLEEDKGHYMVADPEGMVRRCSPGMRAAAGMRLTDEELEVIRQGKPVWRAGSHPRFDTKVLSVAVPIKKDGEVMRAIFVFSPLEPITETINGVKRVIALFIFGSALLASGFAFVISRTISQPLLQMNRVATEMRRGNFDLRVEHLSDDELGALGATLNVLAAELKETLAQLGQERDRLNNILASMSDGVATFDREGRVILANARAEELLAGLDGTEEKLQEGAALTSCCPQPETEELFRQVLVEGRAVQGEVARGEKVLQVRMAPLRDEKGETVGVVALFHDMSQEARLEKMRRDFVASVSHELRNPLFLIQGYTEALLHGLAENREEREAILQIIMEETGRMQRLVSDLLDLARIESGTFSLQVQPVVLDGLLRRALQRFAQPLEEKDIHLEVEVAPDLPPVLADPDRVMQIVGNLLDNAIRFTPRGGKIGIRAQKEVGKVRVEVWDTGIGIPAEDLPYVWERFYRAEKSRTRRAGGTGLGLAIVKKLVEAHGGQVGIESAPGQGTRVFFTLPVAA
ncbi:MAG: two-component system, OmpR family, sensor histidine kinase ResE [Eubacteriales bacterium]|nr:two-component system, OmpR family, sensor histidine kinase ResE [Eubacteriales bacterium]